MGILHDRFAAGSCVLPDGRPVPAIYAVAMDLMLTYAGLASFFALVATWVALPHAEKHESAVHELTPARQAA